MNTYNPNQAPDPDEWKALAEDVRLLLVKQYHKHKRIRLPNATLHAVFHAVVENQVAMGDEMNVARTLQRLLSEGLDRHDAIHAIGFVLAGHMRNMMSGAAPTFNETQYASDLEALTPEKWIQMAQPED